MADQKAALSWKSDHLKITRDHGARIISTVIA